MRRVLLYPCTYSTLNQFRENVLQRSTCNYVATLTVGVEQQREMSTAVGVVLNTLNNRRYAVLIALEINDSIALLVSTTPVTYRDSAIIVAPIGSGSRFHQWSIGPTLV